MTCEFGVRAEANGVSVDVVGAGLDVCSLLSFTTRLINEVSSSPYLKLVIVFIEM